MNYVDTYLRLEDRATGAESKVEEYRQRADENRWEQCRIASEAVNEGGFTQAAFAREVGVSAKTISRQCEVWRSCGKRTLASRPSYSDAIVAAMGTTQAAETDRKQVVNAKAVLKDPELVKELLADRTIRNSLADAQAVFYEQAEARQRARTPGVVEAREESSAVIAGLRAVRALRECVRGLQGVKPNAHLREELAAIVEQVHLYVDVIENASEARHTLTEEIEQFLANTEA